MHAGSARNSWRSCIFFRTVLSSPSRSLLERQRATCEAWLESLVQQAELAREKSLFDELVFTYRVHQVEAILGWLADCEKAASFAAGS